MAEVTIHVAACELGVHVPVPRAQQGIVREHNSRRWGDHGHSGRILCTLCRVPPDLTVIQCRSQIEPTKLLSCADLRSSSGDALAVTVDLPVDDQVSGSDGAATSVIMESGWSRCRFPESLPAGSSPVGSTAAKTVPPSSGLNQTITASDSYQECNT